MPLYCDYCGREIESSWIEYGLTLAFCSEKCLKKYLGERKKRKKRRMIENV